MGMAKSLKQPVAISLHLWFCCHQLLSSCSRSVLSRTFRFWYLPQRDRTDFVDLFDGQTIRQKDLFQQHSYGDFQLLEDDKENAEEENLKIVKTAIELCFEKQGPVHINIPLTEPLYQYATELPVFPSIEKTIQKRDFEISSTSSF